MADELIEMGRGKNAKKWLPDLGPKPLGRWSKKYPAGMRHYSLLKKTSEKGCLRVLRDLNALANVTRDKATAKLLRKDYRWLRAQSACKLKSKKG